MLNSKAATGSIPKELEALFNYINEGKINPGRDDFIDEVHQKVLELNGDEKLMGVMTLEMDRRMREDWAEERGRREGLAQGIRAFILDNREEGVSEEKIQEKLMKRFNLPEDEAEGYLQEVVK